MLASSFLKVQGETRNNTEQLSLNKDGFIVHLLWLEHNRRRRMYHCIMELDAYHQINIISSPQLLNHRAGVWEETNNYIFNPDDDMMQPLITEILWRRQDVEASSSDNWPTSRDITTTLLTPRILIGKQNLLLTALLVVSCSINLDNFIVCQVRNVIKIVHLQF